MEGAHRATVDACEEGGGERAAISNFSCEKHLKLDRDTLDGRGIGGQVATAGAWGNSGEGGCSNRRP